MIHPILTKQYKTNNRQLWYHSLPVTMFTDTMYSTILSRLSRQKNKADQIFFTDLGYEAVSLLFHRDGVPIVMFMDGAKAQTKCELRRKLCDAGCHIKQTEPPIIFQHG
jgi:hypothetical protein